MVKLWAVWDVIYQTRVGAVDQSFQTQMKARGRRYLETPVKHDARVFDVASKTIHTSLGIRGYCFSALISHESMYFKNNVMLEFCCCSLGLGFRVFKSCGSEEGRVFCSK